MLPRTFVAAATLALLAPAAASADDLGHTFQPSPIRVYRGHTLWSAAPQGAKTYTLTLDGQPLPITHDKSPVEADLSRGPDGQPAVVVARNSEIDLVTASTSKRLVRTGKDAHAISLWTNRLVWVEGRGTVYTATIGGSKHRVSMPVKGARIDELSLFGGELGIGLNTGKLPGDVQAWVQKLDGSHRHLVRMVSSGEADRAFVGLSFDGGALTFAQSCSGDPSGCTDHAVVYRYKSGKLTTSAVPPKDVAGFAFAAGTGYWISENYGSCVDQEANPAPCLIQSAPLQFASQ